MRHLIILAVLSIIVALFTSVATQILHVIHVVYNYLDALLSVKIGGYEIAQPIRIFIALVIMPIIAGAMVRFAYWLLKRQASAVIPGVAWGVWLIMVTMIAAHSV